MDQVSHACDTWSSETQRPPPERSLLGRVPSVVIPVVAPLDVADPVGPNRRVMEQGRALSGRVTLGKPFEGVEQDVVGERHLIRREVAFEHAPVGPNCSMQYVMKGAIDVANSSEPMGLVRVCQSNPRRGMPMPPSLRWTLGHAATAAMPRRQVASTSSSRWPYGPTRFKPPRWFRMMVSSGTALAKAASSGSWGKHNPVSRDSPIRASTCPPARKSAVARTPSCSRLPTSGCGSQVTVCRIPRNRLGLAACSASNTG